MARENDLCDIYYFRFVAVCFVALDMVCFDVYSTDNWKRGIFCCYCMEWPTAVCRILLVGSGFQIYILASILSSSSNSCYKGSIEIINCKCWFSVFPFSPVSFCFMHFEALLEMQFWGAAPEWLTETLIATLAFFLSVPRLILSSGPLLQLCHLPGMCLLQPVLHSLSLSPPPSLSPIQRPFLTTVSHPQSSSSPQWSYFFQHLTLPEIFCCLNCLCLSPTVGCKVHKNWELLSFFFFNQCPQYRAVE